MKLDPQRAPVCKNPGKNIVCSAAGFAKYSQTPNTNKNGYKNKIHVKLSTRKNLISA